MFRLFTYFSALVFSAGFTMATTSTAEAGPGVRRAPAKAKPGAAAKPRIKAGALGRARVLSFTCTASPHSGELLATGNVHVKASGKAPANRKIAVVVSQPDATGSMTSNLCTNDLKAGVISTTVNFPVVR